MEIKYKIEEEISKTFKGEESVLYRLYFNLVDEWEQVCYHLNKDNNISSINLVSELYFYSNFTKFEFLTKEKLMEAIELMKLRLQCKIQCTIKKEEFGTITV